MPYGAIQLFRDDNTRISRCQITFHGQGYILTKHNPNYVVLGESDTLNFDVLTKAIQLVKNGSRFIATNPDISGPRERGIVPGCGVMAALIEKASGVNALYIGKPNPLMMRSTINYLGIHSENTVMVGDQMDTDIIAGVQTGMDTILGLPGLTRLDDVAKFPKNLLYRQPLKKHLYYFWDEF